MRMLYDEYEAKLGGRERRGRVMRGEKGKSKARIQISRNDEDKKGILRVISERAWLSLFHLSSPLLPSTLFLINAIFAIPQKPVLQSLSSFSLSLSPLSLSLSLSLSLPLSLSLTDVGQCVWSLSGAFRASELHAWSSSTPSASANKPAMDTAFWAT